MRYFFSSTSSFVGILLITITCFLGCGSNTQSTAQSDAATTAETNADSSSDKDDVERSATAKKDNDEQSATVPQLNPDAKAIKTLEALGATLHTNDEGRVTGVCFPDDAKTIDVDSLVELSELNDLVLSWKKIEHLSAVAKLKQLKRLDISWTDIGDEQIDALVAAKHLEVLDVAGADFTDEGIERLRTEMSDTFIRRESDTALTGLPAPEPEDPPAPPEMEQKGGFAIGERADDIVGKDAEGTEFKLSDYRGKVVVIDFFANWCGPCRAAYPHNRELMKRHAEDEFVFLGVNCDPVVGTLKRSMDDENVTWRSWWDGGEGPISAAWQIEFLPTIYVLDGEGIVRYRNVRGEELDDAVAKLLAKPAQEPSEVVKEVEETTE